MQQGPIEANRLLRSKALLMGDVPIRQASYDGVADQFLNYAGRGRSLDQSTIDARAELAASAASIQAAFVKVIRPDAFVRIVTGPGPK